MAQYKLIFKALTTFHSCNNISDYQKRVFLLILHPKLILQRTEHYITVSLRPKAEFYFVILITFGLFHSSNTTQKKNSV